MKWRAPQRNKIAMLILASCSSVEDRFRQTFDANVYGEEAAGHWRRCEAGLVHMDPAAVLVFDRGRCGKERVHIDAAEGAAGDAFHGHRDLAVDAPVRCIARD